MKAKVIQTPISSLSETPSKEELKQAINWAMSNNGLGEDFYRTIECESNFVYWAFGDYSNGKYLAYGIGQFHKDTWNLFNKIRNTKLDYYSTKDQLDMMLWAWKNNRQNNWSCWNNIFGN